MLRRSFSSDDIALSRGRPSIRDELLAPRVLPSKVYNNLVRDAFYPARQANLYHSRSYTDFPLRWRLYTGAPVGSAALDYLVAPGWRDRLDARLWTAERVMDDVHKSLFPSKHYINVGEWAYFDWDSARVVEPMHRPCHRMYSAPRYSRCWDTRQWNSSYGRTFSHAAYDRWSRFAGNRKLAGSWQSPPFWMHRFSQDGIFTPYYKNPWYFTPMHHYYDYINI